MKASITDCIWLAITILLNLSFITTSFGQRGIWSDDFASAGDGATSGNNWRVLATTDCDPQPSTFNVVGSAFVINDMEGSGCTGSEGGSNDNFMQIGPIDVSGAGCLRVGYTIDASGSFETTGSGADQLIITVSLDGAAVGGSTFVTNGPLLNLGPKLISVPLSGNNLTITIQGGNQSIDEFYSISNIFVEDVSFTPSIPPFSVCKDETFNLNQLSPTVPGIWSGTGVNANQWFTFNLEAGEVYELTFDPVDPCGASVTVEGTIVGGSPAGSGTLASCSSTTTAIFDLTQADEDVLDGQEAEVFWFRDENKQNPIPNATSYTAEDGDLVYGAYLDDEGCISEAGMITLRIQEPTPPEPVDDVQTCVSYTLPVLDPGLRYDGRSAGDVITSDQTITITTGSGACIISTSYTVTILPAPDISPYSGPTEACDSLALPIITGTNLTGTQAYYTERGGQGVRYDAGGSYQEIGSSTLYLYDGSGTCSDEDSVQLEVNEYPLLNLRDTIVCDTFAFLPYEGPGNLRAYYSERNGGGTEYQPGQGLKRDPGTVRFYALAGDGNCTVEDSFDITFRLAPDLVTISGFQDCDTFRLPEIGGDNLSGNEAYFTLPGGQGPSIPAGTLLEETTTLYVYDRIGSCPDELILPVFIIQRPRLAPVPDTVVCDTLILPEIAGDQLSGAQGYWTEPFGVGTVYDPGAVMTSSQKLYVYDERAGCSAQDSFEITVNTRPRITAPIGERYLCDTFALPSITGRALSGNEAYFEGPNAQGQRYEPGAVIRDSIRLFVYDQRANCPDQETLDIYVAPTPILDSLTDISTCDFYVLPGLSGQNLTNAAAYFDADTRERFLPGDTLFTNRALEAIDSNAFGCRSLVPFNVVITPSPQLASVSNLEVCDRLILPAIEGRFLPASTSYFTDTLGSGFRLNAGTQLEVSQKIYLFADTLGCRDEVSFAISVDYTPRVRNAAEDTTACFAIELPVLAGRDLSANTAYYDQPEGMGSRIDLPLRLSADTTLYLFGNNGTCYLRDTIEIEVNQLSADLLVTDSINCFGETGQIELRNIMAKSPVAIRWSDPIWDGNTILSDIPAGTYGLNLSDPDNCVLDTSITLNQPDAMDLNCGIIQQVSVPNGMDGQINLSLVGGTAPYSLFLSGDLVDTLSFLTPVDLELDTLSAGTYTFTVMDNKACTQSCTQTITAPPCALAVDLRATDITCGGEEDGRIESLINNAQAPLQIDWSDDQLDGLLNLDNLSAGTYSLTVTDANACVDSTEVRIIEPAILSLTASSGQPVSNGTANDGMADITFSGGTAPYQLIYDGPLVDTLDLANSGDLSIDSLRQGIYDIIIIDANNCQAATRLTITNPNCGMQVSFARVDQQCPNTADGSLTTIVTGGIAPYQFIWQDGNRDSIRNDLAKGIYQLTLLDSDHCVLEVSDTINIAHPLPNLALLGDTIRCDSACQSFELSLSGTAPFSFSWSLRRSQAGQDSTILGVVGGANGNTETLTFCEGGEQLRLQINTLEDAHCRITLDTSFTREVLPVPSILVTDTLCQGDSLLLEGQVFDENHTSDTRRLSNRAANGCDSLIYVDLTFIPTVFDTLRQTLCREDRLVLNGTVYDFANPVGTETFAGQSTMACDSVLYVSLSFYPVDTNFISATLCSRDSLELGGRVFNAANPGGIVTLPNAAATGCDSIIEVQIDFIDQFSSALVQSICPGDSLLVNGTRYDQFRLSGTEVFTSAGGCDSIVSIDLSLLPIDTNQVVQSLCPGDSIVVNGIVYNENNVQGLQILEGASANGCDSLIKVNINYFSEIRTFYRDTLCYLDSLTVNGTVYHNGRTTGVEEFPGQGQNGCDSIVEIDLHFWEPITAELTGTTAICAGESAEIQLVLSGAERYDVFFRADDNPPITLAGVEDGARIPILPLETTEYRILAVQDSRLGCVGRPAGEKVTVSVSNIAVELAQVPDYNGFGVSCAGAADGLLRAEVRDGLGPYTYTWSNGGLEATNNDLSAGTYEVTVTDQAGCRDSLSQILLEPEPLQFDVDFSPSTCASKPNGRIRILSINGGVMPYAYNLDNRSFQTIEALPFAQGGLSAGAYTLQLRDDNGCRSSTPFTILEDNLRIEFGGDLELRIGDSLRLEPEANFDLVNFEWQPLEDLSDSRSVRPFVSPNRTRAYTLTALDTSGCQVSTSVMVYVHQTRKVYAPSAFTPNEDGANDRFTLFGDDDLQEIALLQVYDRWGNLLHEERELRPNDDHLGWDGTFQGELMSAGAYVYRAILRFNNGDEQQVEGEVLLLR